MMALNAGENPAVVNALSSRELQEFIRKVDGADRTVAERMLAEENLSEEMRAFVETVLQTVGLREPPAAV